jgi:hypothetical protein
MTVYVVYWWDYDSVGNAGVYSTRELAEAAVAECKLNDPELPYDIDEFQVDAPADRPSVSPFRTTTEG